MDKRTGASPSCLRASHNPWLLMLSLRFCPCDANVAASVGRFETPFIQRSVIIARFQIVCKDNAAKYFQKRTAPALMALAARMLRLARRPSAGQTAAIPPKTDLAAPFGARCLRSDPKVSLAFVVTLFLARTQPSSRLELSQASLHSRPAIAV